MAKLGQGLDRTAISMPNHATQKRLRSSRTFLSCGLGEPFET